MLHSEISIVWDFIFGQLMIKTQHDLLLIYLSTAPAQALARDKKDWEETSKKEKNLATVAALTAAGKAAEAPKATGTPGGNRPTSGTKFKRFSGCFHCRDPKATHQSKECTFPCPTCKKSHPGTLCPEGDVSSIESSLDDLVFNFNNAGIQKLTRISPKLQLKRYSPEKISESDLIESLSAYRVDIEGKIIVKDDDKPFCFVSTGLSYRYILVENEYQNVLIDSGADTCVVGTEVELPDSDWSILPSHHNVKLTNVDRTSCLESNRVCVKRIGMIITDDTGSSELSCFQVPFFKLDIPVGYIIGANFINAFNVNLLKIGNLDCDFPNNKLEIFEVKKQLENPRLAHLPTDLENELIDENTTAESLFESLPKSKDTEDNEHRQYLDENGDLDMDSADVLRIVGINPLDSGARHQGLDYEDGPQIIRESVLNSFASTADPNAKNIIVLWVDQNLAEVWNDPTKPIAKGGFGNNINIRHPISMLIDGKVYNDELLPLEINKEYTHPIRARERNLSKEKFDYLIKLAETKVEHNMFVERTLHDFRIILCPIIVLKSDGKSFRTCSDSRIGNKCLVPRVAITMSVTTQFTHLRGAKSFCCIDAREFYSQLQYNDIHRVYGIAIGSRYFEQLRGGMGYMNSEYLAQITMDLICKKENIDFSIALRKADNILVYGKDDMECAQKLVFVLEGLAKHNVIINPKCLLLSNNCTFMGYLICEKGITKSPRLLNKFLGMDTPRNLFDISNCIHSLNFMRENIPNFSALVAPLKKFIEDELPLEHRNRMDNKFLTKYPVDAARFNASEVKFVWDELRRKAYTPLFFYVPAPGEPMFLLVDASLLGWGFILAIVSLEDFEKPFRECKSFKPIASGSGIWTEAQQRYTNTVRELCSAVIAVKRTFSLTRQHPIRCMSDHFNNCYTPKFEEQDTWKHEQRFKLDLVELGIQLEHLEGDLNMSDFLSRAQHEIGVYTNIKGVAIAEPTQHVNPYTPNTLPPDAAALPKRIGFYGSPDIVIDTILELTSQHVGNVSSVIELGAGTGRILSKIIQKYRPNLSIGYEKDVQAVEIGLKLFPDINLIKQDITAVSFGKQYSHRIQLIVFNPPFSLVFDFLKIAMKLLSQDGFIIMVGPSKLEFGNFKVIEKPLGKVVWLRLNGTPFQRELDMEISVYLLVPAPTVAVLRMSERLREQNSGKGRKTVKTTVKTRKKVVFENANEVSPSKRTEEIVIKTDNVQDGLLKAHLDYGTKDLPIPLPVNWTILIRENVIHVTHLADDKMYTKENNIFYCQSKGRKVIYLPKNCRLIALAAEHHLEFGHPSWRQTLAGLETKYYWETIAEDTKLFISKCFFCACTSSPKLIPRPIGHLYYGSFPCEHISMDFGSLEGTEFLLFVDSFSGFLNCYIDHDGKRSALFVAKALFHWSTRYSSPRSIGSDQGPEFLAQVVQQLKGNLKITHFLPVVHSPTSRGLIERFVGIYKSLAIKVVTASKMQKAVWWKFSDTTQYILNHRISSRSKAEFAPVDKFLGPAPSARASIVYLNPNTERFHPLIFNEQMEDEVLDLKVRYSLILQDLGNELKNRDYQREKINEHRLPLDFTIGDIVLQSSHEDNGSIAKHSVNWTTLSEVTKLFSDQRARIRELSTGKIVERKTSCLKLFESKGTKLPKNVLEQDKFLIMQKYNIKSLGKLIVKTSISGNTETLDTSSILVSYYTPNEEELIKEELLQRVYLKVPFLVEELIKNSSDREKDLLKSSLNNLRKKLQSASLPIEEGDGLS